MKLFNVIALLVFINTSVNAQINWSTGSAEMDANLNTINTDAKKDLSLFKKDVSAEFSISTRKIDAMLSIGMEPGEVYFSLEIAKVTNKPVDDVVKSYRQNKDKGWGYIAKQMGIKPGSEAFHQLKGKSKKRSDKARSKSGGNNSESKGKGNSSKGNSKGNSKKK